MYIYFGRQTEPLDLILRDLKGQIHLKLFRFWRPVHVSHKALGRLLLLNNNEII